MSAPNQSLISAIRRTAQNLAHNAPYQWGHMGSCNCGNLAQELTQRSKAEIHQFAMRSQGDWHEQVESYCPSSGLPMDLLIHDMLERGLSTQDLQQLERLSNPHVLARIAPDRRHAMRHNVREDVILYLNEWANALEVV